MKLNYKTSQLLKQAGYATHTRKSIKLIELVVEECLQIANSQYFAIREPEDRYTAGGEDMTQRIQLLIHSEFYDGPHVK